MQEHIVLLKLKPKTNKIRLERLCRNMHLLKEKIPGILSITLGKNNSPEGQNRGFDYGFIVRFENSAARDNYLIHAEHQKISKEHVLPIIDDFLVFDYET